MTENFPSRLKQAMELRKIKPFELSNSTQLDKSLISNYLSGKYKPKQENLTVIAEKLNVSEIWLLGYDVPIDRNDNISSDELLNDYKELLSKDKYLKSTHKDFIYEIIEDQHKKSIEKGVK